MKSYLLLSLIFGILLSYTTLGSIPNAYAADFEVKMTCHTPKLQIRVLDSNGDPISGAIVYTIQKISSTNFEKKFTTDFSGNVEITPTENTGFVRISKAGFNEQRLISQSCSESNIVKQSMKIFTQSSSTVGVTKDTMTGNPVVDLGTIFGIAGTGTLPDYIVVEKDSRKVGTIPRESIAPASAHGQWQISQTYFTDYQSTGLYKLRLFTDDNETFVFEFFIRQINFSVMGTPTEQNLVEKPKPQATLISKEPTNFADRWLTKVKFCPNGYGVNEATIMFETDMEQVVHSWSSPIMGNNCGEDFFEIKANNPQSIIVRVGGFGQDEQLRDTTSLQTQVDSLKEEISSLKEQLKSKDAILMEQLKVIQQLASSFKKTFFDPVSTILGFT